MLPESAHRLPDHSSTASSYNERISLTALEAQIQYEHPDRDHSRRNYPFPLSILEEDNFQPVWNIVLIPFWRALLSLQKNPADCPAYQGGEQEPDEDEDN